MVIGEYTHVFQVWIVIRIQDIGNGGGKYGRICVAQSLEDGLPSRGKD